MSHKIQFTVNDRTFIWVEKSCKNLGIEKNDFMNLVLRSTKLLGQLEVDLGEGDAPVELPKPAEPVDPNLPIDPSLPVDPNLPADPDRPIEHVLPVDSNLPSDLNAPFDPFKR